MYKNMADNKVLEQYHQMRRELNSIMLEPLTKLNVDKQERNMRSLLKKYLKESIKIGIRMENIQGTLEPMNPFQAAVLAQEFEDFRIDDLQRLTNSKNIVVELGGVFPEGYIDPETEEDLSGKSPTTPEEVAKLMEVYKEAQEAIAKDKEVEIESLQSNSSQFKQMKEEIKAKIKEERDVRKNLIP